MPKPLLKPVNSLHLLHAARENDWREKTTDGKEKRYHELKRTVSTKKARGYAGSRIPPLNGENMGKDSVKGLT